MILRVYQAPSCEDGGGGKTKLVYIMVAAGLGGGFFLSPNLAIGLALHG